MQAKTRLIIPFYMTSYFSVFYPYLPVVELRGRNYLFAS